MLYSAGKQMKSADDPGLDCRLLELLQPYQLARDLARRQLLLPAYIILDWLVAYGFACPEWKRDLKKVEAEILLGNPRIKRDKRLFYTRRHCRASLDARLLSFLIPYLKKAQRKAILEIVENIEDPSLRIPLLINCAAEWGGLRDWVQCMNQYFSFYHLAGCSPLQGSGLRRLLRRSDHILQDVEMQSVAGEELKGGCGLVTVIMSAYNAEATIGYAIKSILRQSYADLELVVIDDASLDRTAQIIDDYASRDSRIVPLFLNVNSGPYECRNLALKRVKGAYITTHDSDDLCHPQRLSMQVQFLSAHSETVAVIGQWLRIGPRGHVLYHNKRGGAFLHGGLATMMYRAEVINRIGRYDGVRYSADTEFLFRLRKVFGAGAVASIRRPLALAAHTDGSLTGCAGSRSDSFFGDCESRAVYRSAWEKWHAESDPQQLCIPFDSEIRMFQAPEEMLTGSKGVSG